VPSIIETRKAVDQAHDRIDGLQAQGQKGALARSGITEQRGPFLSRKQSVSPFFERERKESYSYDPKNVKVGNVVAGLAFGDAYKSALNDDEQKSLLTLAGPGGDYLVPEGVQGPLIDAVRAKTRVIQAGAVTLPMLSQVVRIPGWVSPGIQSGWAGEFTALPDGGGQFRAINLVSRAVGCVVSLSTELIEDAGPNLGGIEARVTNEIARANALAIDKAALIGGGSQDEPLGIYPRPAGRPDILVQTLGANGVAPTNWDFIIQLIGSLRTANFDPNAVIYSPRTEQELGTLKLTTNDYLKPPAYLDDVALLATGQIPVNLTKGTSNASSIAVAGQWDQCVIGFRPDMTIRMIRNPYSKAAQRVVDLVCWQRVDVGYFNTSAFAVADGIN